MGWLTLCIIFINVYQCLVTAAEPDLFLSQQYDVQLNEGEKQYRLIQSNANLPQYGKCWTEAIRQIDATCSALNEKSQAMLALRFTKCFMAMSGGERDMTSNLDACEDTDCIGNMSERVFQAYTNFYTHTQNICFYLMHQIWHAETEKTIHLLKSHSHSVSKQLELSGRLQMNLLMQQREGLKLQQKLVEHGVNLSEVLNDSQSSLSRLTEQFRNSTIEQGRQLGDLFQRLSQFHYWIVGEYTFVEQIMYYAVLLGVIFIATTAKRSENCRFLIFLLALLNLLIESLFQRYLGADYYIEDLKIILFESLRLIRKVFGVVMITVYVTMSVMYVDSQKVTLSLLQKIYEQNTEILQSLRDIKSKPTNESYDRHGMYDRPNILRPSCDRDDATARMIQKTSDFGGRIEFDRRSRMTPSVIRELSVDKITDAYVGVTTRLRSRQPTPIL